MHKLKLKAGILPFIFSISLVLVGISTAIILMGYYHRFNILSWKKESQATTYLADGLQLSLAFPYKKEEVDTVQLYGGDIRSKVVIGQGKWGMLQQVNVEVASHPSLSKTYIKGFRNDSVRNTALVLADKNEPLMVCGNTRIKGNVALSSPERHARKLLGCI